mmetsp:Transcript_48632/g.104746  ORF Transcript_48632/g.104746 Transcript_48632/m.104746 type:complete len:296 (+) Transcript_48632:1-888(+)
MPASLPVCEWEQRPHSCAGSGIERTGGSCGIRLLWVEAPRPVVGIRLGVVGVAAPTGVALGNCDVVETAILPASHCLIAEPSELPSGSGCRCRRGCWVLTLGVETVGKVVAVGWCWGSRVAAAQTLAVGSCDAKEATIDTVVHADGALQILCGRGHFRCGRKLHLFLGGAGGSGWASGSCSTSGSCCNGCRCLHLGCCGLLPAVPALAVVVAAAPAIIAVVAAVAVSIAAAVSVAAALHFDVDVDGIKAARLHLQALRGDFTFTGLNIEDAGGAVEVADVALLALGTCWCAKMSH